MRIGIFLILFATSVQASFETCAVRLNRRVRAGGSTGLASYYANEQAILAFLETLFDEPEAHADDWDLVLSDEMVRPTFVRQVLPQLFARLAPIDEPEKIEWLVKTFAEVPRFPIDWDPERWSPLVTAQNLKMAKYLVGRLKVKPENAFLERIAQKSCDKCKLLDERLGSIVDFRPGGRATYFGLINRMQYGERLQDLEEEWKAILDWEGAAHGADPWEILRIADYVISIRPPVDSDAREVVPIRMLSR